MEREKIQIMNKVSATEILDMPQDKFEDFIKSNKVSVGEASNLDFYFKSLYQRTTLEKDAILLKVKNGELHDTKPEVKNHLQNMYLLLADIEQKVSFLTQYIKDIMSN